MSDSRIDTYAHIQNVQRFMAIVIAELTERMLKHDASKLVSPEVEVYNEYENELRVHDYNTPEYWETLKKMAPAIEHHYENNPHHPEHHPDGISGMSLVDLIEMLCDWKAASMRRPNSMSLIKSIEVNEYRFHYDGQLYDIFLNTASLLEKEDA